MIQNSSTVASRVRKNTLLQVLYPEITRMPTKDDLKKYNIVEEKPYFAEKAEILKDFDVIGLMQRRRSSENCG